MSKKRSFGEAKYWVKPSIKVEWTKEELSSYASTGTLIDLFYESPHLESFKKSLPERISNNSYPTEVFALALMSGFLHGHDSLDDQEEYEDEPMMGTLLGELPKARAIGDWLRDFEAANIDKLNSFLHLQAMSYRKKIALNQPIIIDIDSTSHVQHGEKMEGLAWNYKNEWCLDSLVAYDEMGLCHGMMLRPGNTFSSQGAGNLLGQISKDMKFEETKYFRADSAFCNEEVLRACLRHGYQFTITAHENMGWKKDYDQITNWKPWVYSEEELIKAKKREKELPFAEMGHYYYQPSWSENIRFKVIVIRTKSNDLSLLSEAWDYYAILTNFDLFHTTDQAVITHHRKRGNAENFIKEEKYAYDLKHFPCQKLMANHAYGLLALVTHNFLRVIAYLDSPDKPHFTKKLRRKFVFIPGRLIKHARSLVMKIPIKYQKEVTRLIEAWRYKPGPAIGFA